MGATMLFSGTDGPGVLANAPAAGDVVLVTGAAGGVGAAVVEAVRAAGGRVVAEDISAGLEARHRGDDDVHVITGDVADPGTAEAAVAAALERFGRLDALVNVAARFHSAPLEDIGAEDWDALMATNIRGVHLHVRAAVAALAERRGAIVNVASISGLVGLPAQMAYSATKGAVVQMTRAAAVELAPRGIRVNAVAPGAIATGFMDEALAGDPDPEATWRAIAVGHPLGRIATPEQVAAPIAFLLSAGAGAITGAVLTVDGGYTAQ